MRDRYRLFRRNAVFYVQDNQTGQQTSLRTRDKAEAMRLLSAKNQSATRPELNRGMARVYLSCQSSDMLTRTWKTVMEEVAASYTGNTLKR